MSVGRSIASAKCAASIFVTLVLEPLPVRGQLGQFVRAGGEAFIERGLDLGGEGCVVGLGDRDVLVAVGDELLSDTDGNGAASAVLASRSSP